MKKLKIVVVVFSVLLISSRMVAQDPSFSQFFSSPLNINPALTADINSKWRLITNYRNQWVGPNNPYTTGTVSFDSKIFQNTVENYVDEITRVGIGGMIMYDETMGGALKSNYASLNLSGNIRLGTGNGREMNGYKIRHISKIKMDDAVEQRLGVGISVSYGDRRIDLSKLTFEDQFNGTGFDASLPSNESAQANMKGYFSANAGLLYSSISSTSNFDFGVSAFHINKPKQTFLGDQNQFLPMRYVAHANYEKIINDQVVFNSNGIYQYQSGASYFSIGGALGYYLPTGDDENEKLVNAGLWYWSNNAIVPYFGFSYGTLQLGLSYDITISKLNEAAKRMHTFELSLIFRSKNSGKDNGVIPAPWK